MNDKLLSEAVKHLSSIAKGVNSLWSFIFAAISAISAAVAAVASLCAVHQTRELEKDRLLPIVIPLSPIILNNQTKEINLTVENIGRGIAKDFYLRINNYEVKAGKEKINKVEQHWNWNIKVGKRDIKSPYSFIQIKKLLKKQSKIELEFNYKDVNNRNFKTIGTKIKVEEDRLEMREWEFDP